MKSTIIDVLKYLLVVTVIPVLCVSFSVFLRISQGEKVEEILFGIIAGVILDLIYSMYILLFKKISLTK